MKGSNLRLGGGVAIIGIAWLWYSGPQRLVPAEQAAQAADRPVSSVRPARVGVEVPGIGDRPEWPTVAAGGSGNCSDDDPLDWFGDIRWLPECFRNFYGAQDLGYCDVNADGVKETFGFANGQLIVNDIPQAAYCALGLQDVEFVGGQLIKRESCILDTSRLIPFAAELGPSISYCYITAMGWQDLDRDSDLDLVVTLAANRQDSSGQIEFIMKGLWLENTGFEATQPLVGDLNRDGAVNPADLAILLGGWTG